MNTLHGQHLFSNLASYETATQFSFSRSSMHNMKALVTGFWWINWL